MAGQTITGKAFEYACLVAFREEILNSGKYVEVEDSPQFKTAQDAFFVLSNESKDAYMQAAKTAVKLIFPLEPMITNGMGSIILSLNTDASGVAGDVRDLLCIRMLEGWEIGVSCKHQHEALKHPRITNSCDFGSDWVGEPCSEEFINTLNYILKPLDGTKKWNEFEDKQSEFYEPILDAFESELEKLCQISGVPERLLGYFFGTEDFYKIISKDSVKQTKIYGFNMNGTMNQAAEKVKPIYKVARLTLPKRLIEVRRKENSKTTIILVFDHGWTVSMRLHNKDRVAKPTSLAWDVNLVGLPPEIYQQQRSWNE